jgi:hypothetical protein
VRHRLLNTCGFIVTRSRLDSGRVQLPARRRRDGWSPCSPPSTVRMILSALVFGRQLTRGQVSCRGITATLWSALAPESSSQPTGGQASVRHPEAARGASLAMRVTDGQRGQMLTLRRGRGGPKVTPGANLMSVDGPGVGVVRQGVMTRGTRRLIATSAKRRQEDQRPVRIIPIPARITPSAGSRPATLKMALPRPKSTRKTASVGPWVPCCGPDWTRAKKTVAESLIALAPPSEGVAPSAGPHLASDRRGSLAAHGTGGRPLVTAEAMGKAPNLNDRAPRTELGTI